MTDRSRAYNNPFVIALGKTVQALARLRGGGGSAFPGLVVDKVAPSFAPKVLGSLPCGVVVISATNGKTTTTKIVTELLQSQNLRVLTNDSGSNFMRGVIAALLSRITLGGRLDADIAVLELDEAHAVQFAKRVPPRYTLLLNVMPDQLDRFGTVEYTARLLRQVAHMTTGAVIANREDRHLVELATTPPPQARLLWFGLAPQLRDDFIQKEEKAQLDAGVAILDERLHAAVELAAVDGSWASFEIDGSTLTTALTLKGVYNAYNAAAALALTKEILSQRDGTDKQEHNSQLNAQLIEALAQVQSAFGRGESFVIEGQPVEMVLVKNAGGFRLALESFDPSNSATMIVINDDIGDGRDVSWLFDVDFSSLRKPGVALVSGTRAWDMALRLGYDEVPCHQVESDPLTALDCLLTCRDTLSGAPQPLQIYCTYTAMTKLRPRLSTQADARRVSL
ncbi:MAG: MurT ligase domain-containing protein [Coriobacteriia bacterium]|nr:MurT ligase domain-containing protein [Coriobacteriia bacterium]